MGPLVLILSPVFLYFPKSASEDFSGHSENFCFLHIKQHHGSSAENSVSRVSFIQIMQVRVQNKGKSVWKSRYVGDVSVLLLNILDLYVVLLVDGVSFMLVGNTLCPELAPG